MKASGALLELAAWEWGTGRGERGQRGQKVSEIAYGGWVKGRRWGCFGGGIRKWGRRGGVGSQRRSTVEAGLGSGTRSVVLGVSSLSGWKDGGFGLFIGGGGGGSSLSD